MAEPEEPNPAWIERVVAIAAAVGFNPVRVRWKLQRGVNRRREARNRRDNANVHVQYEHKVCPQCHAVNDRSEQVCTRCKTELHSRARELAGRLGVRSPLGTSMTTLLGLLIVAVYVRTAIASGTRGVDIPIGVLIAHGGNLPLGHDGEWWRAATSVFLHAGIIHLAFNLVSLAVVGPFVQDHYGRGFGVLAFLVTGAGAALVSQHTGLDGVGIGASGAIMGLIGLAAGASQRDGTTRGKHTRDDMLKWALFVVLFGFMVGADNRAHLAGLVLGGAAGLAVKPAWLTRASSRPLRLGLGTVALVAAAATVTAAMVPLSTPSPMGYVGDGDRDDHEGGPYDTGDPGDLDDVGTMFWLCEAHQRGDQQSLEPWGGAAVGPEICARVDQEREACRAGVAEADAASADYLARRCAQIRRLDER